MAGTQAPVPGRECGACTVCCIIPSIDFPDSVKPSGVPCHNLVGSGGCAIYPLRPHVCRVFYCGWRQFSIVADGMRPDLCGVAVLGTEAAETGAASNGLMFLVLTDRRALRQPAVLDTIGAALAAGIPCDLATPGPPGAGAQRARLNAILADAIERRDRAGTLSTLQATYFQLRQLARRAAATAWPATGMGDGAARED